MKKILLLIFYLLLISAIFITKAYLNISDLAYIGLTAIMPIIPIVVAKIIHIKINDTILFFYDLFILASMIFGNIFNFYRFNGFDKLLHSTSGILVGAVVYMLYVLLKKDIKIKNINELLITTFFINGLNIFVAFLWECFEFTLLVFFNNDAIHHFDSGVYDTMTDMIVCFVGGLVITYLVYRYYKTNQDNILIKATKEFIQDNNL